MSTCPHVQPEHCKDVLSQVNRISLRCVTLFTSQKEFGWNFFLLFFFFPRAGESPCRNALCLSTLTHPAARLSLVPLWLRGRREDPAHPMMQPMHWSRWLWRGQWCLCRRKHGQVLGQPLCQNTGRESRNYPARCQLPKTPKKTKQSKKQPKKLASLEQLPRRKEKKKKKEANGPGPGPGALFSFPNTMHVK